MCARARARARVRVRVRVRVCVCVCVCVCAQYTFVLMHFLHMINAEYFTYIIKMKFGNNCKLLLLSNKKTSIGQ
jgi:hypothetical protein